MVKIDRDYLKQLIFNRYADKTKSQAILQFAEDVGLSRATIYNVLRYQLPCEEALVKFGTILNIDYNRLFQKGESQR